MYDLSKQLEVGKDGSRFKTMVKKSGIPRHDSRRNKSNNPKPSFLLSISLQNAYLAKRNGVLKHFPVEPLIRDNE